MIPARKTVTPSPSSRAERIVMLQIQLRQMRGQQIWTDGRKIFRGKQIDMHRAAILDRLIDIRSPDHVRTLGAQRWHNMVQLWKLRDSADRRQSVPTRSIAEHAAAMYHCRRDDDPQAGHRAVLGARILRRHYPERWNEIRKDLRNQPGDIAPFSLET